MSNFFLFKSAHAHLGLKYCRRLSTKAPDGISKLLRVIIMGPPGSGKGTISNRIIKDFPLLHLASGDLLRANMLQKTEVGLEAKKYIDQGQLVPDSVMIDLIAGELHKLNNSCWLLDGFPRTVPQADALHAKEPADLVINLDVPFDIIINRTKGRWIHAASGRTYHTEFSPPKIPGRDDLTGDPLIQRDDDKEDVVRARLVNYQKLTQPVLNFYNDRNLLEAFSGKYSNEIWPRVHKFLSAIITPRQYTHYE